jgi:predicted  nucleic acid-binding Zn-ribbon protein
LEEARYLGGWKTDSFHEEWQKHLAELDNEIDDTKAKIEYCRKKRAQLEHQISTIETRIRNDAEKKRTHRLIVRGAILESMIPDAELRTDEE